MQTIEKYSISYAITFGLFFIGGVFFILGVIEYIQIKKHMKKIIVLQKEYEHCILALKSAKSQVDNKIVQKQKYKTSLNAASEKQKNNQIVSTKNNIHTFKTVSKKSKGFDASWPIEQSKFWLSSYYGPRKKPNGNNGFHHGIDMAAVHGTPVHAAGKGKVIFVDRSKTGFGNRVEIDHGNNLVTRYAHLSKILVSHGQHVNMHDCIGQVGATGNVRGKNGKGKSASHLHFEVLYNGKDINPLDVLTT